jgi:hypothetical protein
VAIFFDASENWTASNNGTQIRFANTPNGSTTRTDRLLLTNTGNLLLQNGGTFTDSGERLQVTGDVKITGSGTSGSIVPFVVRNSAGTELLKVFGNGAIYIPQPAGSNLFLNNISGYNSDTISTGTSRFICGGGYTGINASAQFEIVSTTKGFLPPRMTTTQKNAISSPAAGLVVYDTTDNKHYGYDGTNWNAFY